MFARVRMGRTGTPLALVGTVADATPAAEWQNGIPVRRTQRTITSELCIQIKRHAAACLVKPRAPYSQASRTLVVGSGDRG